MSADTTTRSAAAEPTCRGCMAGDTATSVPRGAGGLPADHPLAAAAAWHALHRAAHAPYARAGQFARWFAAGKLAHDPMFRAVLERGLIAPRARVLDIGCGQGLLASLLIAADAFHAARRWPAAWAAAPVAARYVGVDLMPKDIERGKRALALVGAALPQPPELLCADMCQQPLPDCDVIVVLDVLHYVEPAAQQALLRRMHAALAPGGRLLMRVGDAAGGLRFRISQQVDRAVTLVRGHAAPPTYTRPVAEWTALLGELGFAVQPPLPMSHGTPFANVLLVAERLDAPQPPHVPLHAAATA